MTPALVTPTIPRLQNGDTLDSDEFMRRYEAMPDVKKAELIEGVVYMSSPVRADVHGYPHAELMGWLMNYRIRTPNVRVADNSTVRFGRRNVPQPDALLHIVRGGHSTMNPSGYLVDGPELEDYAYNFAAA